MNKNLLKQYFTIIDEIYDKPPKDAATNALNTMLKYNCNFEYIEKQGKLVTGVLVLDLGNNIYGIGGLVVKKSNQSQGYGKRLMQIVHTKYKGIFLLKTHTAMNFYLKLGYQKLGDMMVYSNSNIVKW